MFTSTAGATPGTSNSVGAAVEAGGWSFFMRCLSFLSRCLASLNAVRPRLVPASRLEAPANPVQKGPYFLAKGVRFRFVDQLQHGLGIHERNRYGSIGFFAHDHVARQQQPDVGVSLDRAVCERGGACAEYGIRA